MEINVYRPVVNRLLLVVAILLSLAQAAVAQLTGTVYRDFNTNGVRETPGEIGVGGVTVTIVSTNGVVTTTTTSTLAASLGSYSVTPGGTGPFRIEFSNLPAGYFAGQKGTNSGTTVQFAASPAIVSLGINYPTDYSQVNPYFLVPCYVNGDPLSTTGNAGAQGSLVGLPYNSVGDTPFEFPLSTGSQVGAVFGVAYQRTAKQVYTAAFVKRHSGLGPGGAGAIYLTKATDATFSAFTSSVFVTLPMAVPVASNAVRGLPGSTTVINQDLSVFDQVGKTGLGDIELSEDGTQLYAVNLSDQKLYRIPINNAASTTPTANTAGITSFSIGTGTGCRTGSVYRPFALKVYRGRVYVGGVCTNESVPTSTTTNFGPGTNNTANLITRDTTGMKAIVYEFNPTTNTFASAIAFPLTYKKGNTDNDQNGVERANYWLPWTEVQPGSTAVPSRFARGDLPNISYPQPWLTGIEFDVDGSMILGIRDRTGDQYGNNNLGTANTTTLYRAIAPGDLLRASKCTPTAALWTLENNASVCSGTSTAGLNNGQGPGGGEYYYSDAVAVPNTTTPFHLEMAQGGMALLPGSGDVSSIVMDPTTNIDAGGIRRFKNADGSSSPSTSFQVYASGNVATYGKANGLGDVELASDNPPIEIGNRVWNDGDSQGADGLQGATNTYLSGITVTLYLNGSPVVSTTTNAAGEYYFNSANVTGGLLPNTNYEIRIPMSQTALANYLPTIYRAGTNNALDNDGVLVNGFTVITLTTGNYGENNHTYDFGFVTCPTITNPSPAVSVCSGTPVSSLSVATNATGTNTIQFVYFTTPQSGTAMYTGGTSLTTATPTNGTATISNVAFPVNNTGAAIVYYVYAILTPTPGPLDCRPAQQILVTINPAVAITITANPGLTICSGSTTTLTANASGGTGFTYRWSTSATTPTLSVSPTTTTTYSVTVTSNTGCFSTTSVTVTVNPAVTTITASASPTTICSGASSTLTATAAGGTGITYAWSNGINTATQTVSPTATTIYTVTATNSTGCSAIASTTITVNPAVTATLGNVTICNGTTVTLNASGGSSYTLSTGAVNTTGTFSVTPTTTTPYSVTVANTSGCSAIATGTVTVNPAVTATVASQTICNGTPATLTATVSGGTGFSYIWAPAGTGNTQTVTVSPTVTTTYSVTATNSTGCSAVTAATVTVNPAVTATVANQTICNGTTATLSVNASGGTGLTYVWAPAGTGNTQTVTVSPTTTTTYSVTVTNSNGCSAIATGTVTVNPAVTAVITASPGNTICNGTSATLTASGGTAYRWSTGAITTAIVVSPASTTVYSVTVTNGNNCSAVTSTTVTVNPAVTVAVGSQTICNGTTATLTATASGGTGITYVWAPAGTGNTQTVTVSPSVTTSYTVTATNSNGCSTTATATVTVNSAVTATLSSATICNGTTVTLSALGGANYLFSNGTANTTGTLNVTPAMTTTYTVTVTSGSGCSAIATGTVTVNPAVTATVASQTICNGTSAILTANASGGTGFSYTWAPTGTGNTQSVTVSPTTTTTYSVTVTNSNGCSAVTSATVTVNPAVTAVITASPGTVICNGTSTTLTASGGNQYRWSTGATTAAIVVSPTSTTAYSVTVTDANNCSATAQTTITVNPAVTVAVGSQTICNGTTATLSATASGGTGLTYAWSPAGTGTTQTVTVSPTTTTTYSVTVTNSNGCSAVTSATVTVNPAVTAVIAVSPSNTICQGTSATLTASGGNQYRWSTGAITAVISVTPANSTIYSVTVTNASGCSAVATSTITVNPAVNAALSSAVICNGVTASLTATGGSSYILSNGASNTSGIFNVNPTTTTTYSVTVTNGSGCSAIATGTVTVNAAVTAIVSVSPSSSICQGTSATITASGGSFYRFSDGTTITNNTSGQLVVTPTTVGSNPYAVTITSGQSCSATASVVITVNALPQPTILGTSTICAGGPISLTATPTTGLTYAWTGPGGNLGSNNPLVIPNSTTANSGTYQVRVTDVNGCTATASRNVTVKPSPVVQIQNVKITCTNNQPAAAIATQVTGGTSPVTYAWYRSGAAGVISTDANPAFSTPDTYSVIVTDANGCVSNTASVTVMTPNPLAVNIQTVNPLCFNEQGRITVQASGGGSPYTVNYYNTGGLLSSTTTTGTSTLQTGAGSYTIVVMDANGCSLTQTAALTQPPLLVVSLTSGGPVCAGQNTGTISSSVSGGTPSYTYIWTGPAMNGATNPNLTNLPGGTYSVVVTDASGCTATQGITIQTNPLPTAPSFTATQPTCVTATGTIRILTPATGVTYSFDNGQSYQTSATLSGLAPGVYRLRVKDNTTGCESTVTSATVNPIPSAPVASIAGSTAYCEGFPISLTASPATGVAYAWTGPGGNLGSSNPLVILNATPAQSGTYRVTVTDVNGCTATASSVITVNPAIVATVNNATLTCQNPTATLTVSSSQLNLSYQWRGPGGFTATTQSVTVSVVGTYTVVTTSTQSGCSATATATVTQDVSLPVTTLTSATLTCQNNYAAVTLTATSTPANTTYQWTGPAGFAANTASINTTIPGIYTVVSTNPQTGCSTTLTTTVAQDAGVQATLTQSTCLNNNTNAVASDDYFTVTIQATNTGNAGTYEVVLGASANGTGGTVLNPGGTAFGTPVTVGGVGQINAKGFRADGSSTYPILIRQVGQTNCRVYRLTGTVAPCSSCFPVPCLPVRVQKQ